MGIKERREREKSYVKTTIMNIVRNIVATQGWSGVTIRKIAEEIEYSPPIIYEHFESKEAILTELKREGYSKLLKIYEKIFKSETDPVEAMISIGIEAYDFAIVQLGYSKALLGLDGIPATDDSTIQEWNDMTALLGEVVSKAIGLQPHQNFDLHQAVILYRCMLRGILSIYILGRAQDDKETVHRLIRSGLKNLVDGWKVQLQGQGF
ncbi:MAG: TetR/AcrR family transcriptional regulator [Chlamydiales bacterium]|nr:TetR/AcrR family transcriptional regulator [Chlamydiia bacterium]MCP5508577.1 TetR/AcrR family transcriptional regulator [Chlamydiales bacterium]